MRCNLLCALTVAATVTPVWAAEYSETTDTIIGQGTLAFVKSPAPSVLATAPSRSYAFGYMNYTFDIEGAPALSYVPVNFLGTYQLVFQGDQKQDRVFGYWSEAAVSFASYDLSTDRRESVSFAGVCNFGLQTGCGTSQLGPDNVSNLYSSIQLTDTKTGAASMSGMFKGVLFAPTDSAGKATGSVYLTVAAGSVLEAGDTRLSTSFIDPHIAIDDDWLAAHQGTSLTLPEGVGNAITAVPEPSTYAMFAGGLVLGGIWFGRRRERGAKPEPGLPAA